MDTMKKLFESIKPSGPSVDSKSHAESMEDDFRRFAAGQEALADAELADFLSKWGGQTACDMAVLSTWEWARKRPVPLWFAALARSKSCCARLVREGAPLSHPCGDARADAWRYAAFNGWAAEAAILFEQQHGQEGLAEDWPGLWAAVSEGCVAQGQGFAERAAGWLGALVGLKMDPSKAPMLAAVGSAIEKAAQGMPKLAPSAGGWDALAQRVERAWGKSTMGQAEAALSGHPRARDLALGLCVVDPEAARAEMIKLMSSFEGSTQDWVLGVAASAGVGMGMGLGEDWNAEKKRCSVWASSVSKLVAQGATIPKGELERASSEGKWGKVYALALAGAKPSGSGAPMLWSLAKHRQQGLLSGALSSLMPPGSPGGIDEQSVDVAMALSKAGCTCSEKGPDGLDAVERLRSVEPSDMESLMSALGKLGAAMGSGPASGTPKTVPSLAQRGLAPLEEFLLSLREREELGEVSSDAQKSRGGAARL